MSESNGSPGSTSGSAIYHVIDPSSASNLVNPTSSGRTDTLRSDHTYQYIEAGTIGAESNNIYEDPNQANYGVSVCVKTSRVRGVVDNAHYHNYLFLIRVSGILKLAQQMCLTLLVSLSQLG